MDTDQIKLQADLVACGAKTDKTEPDPKNLRTGWLTDHLLSAIDGFVVGQQNDPTAYAEIARQALAQIRADEQPEIAALLRLAEFRGERLLPVTLERKQRLLADGGPSGQRHPDFTAGNQAIAVLRVA